ncbi:transposase-like zinc-binding domain-containing protein [Fimbriiglobus ruber]|uniref:IS1/IS1595 family N-terminal zinc-binding domain-containing protein n=1 Tax=Fimbriiglobus ruber TaxID=1908690 RepID=UPI003B845791
MDRCAARAYTSVYIHIVPDPLPLCPDCSATHIVRNGPNSAGTPTFRCRACGRQFVRAPRTAPVTDDQKDLIQCVPRVGPLPTCVHFPRTHPSRLVRRASVVMGGMQRTLRKILNSSECVHVASRLSHAFDVSKCDGSRPIRRLRDQSASRLMTLFYFFR